MLNNCQIFVNRSFFLLFGRADRLYSISQCRAPSGGRFPVPAPPLASGLRRAVPDLRSLYSEYELLPCRHLMAVKPAGKRYGVRTKLLARCSKVSPLTAISPPSNFTKPCKINRLQTKEDLIPIAVRPAPAISLHPPQPPAATFQTAFPKTRRAPCLSLRVAENAHPISTDASQAPRFPGFPTVGDNRAARRAMARPTVIVLRQNAAESP